MSGFISLTSCSNRLFILPGWHDEELALTVHLKYAVDLKNSFIEDSSALLVNCIHADVIVSEYSCVISYVQFFFFLLNLQKPHNI